MSERPSLWLVIPAFMRYDVTRISFPGLRWALTALTDNYGIDGHAVVIADDDNIAIAAEYGFDHITRPNSPLGQKWNDGYEYACAHGADYVVPCGTDDWVDPAYLAQLPGPREIRTNRNSTTVREDGGELAHIFVEYDGGDGLRVIPRTLLEGCNYRPAADHKERAIDTSVWMTLNRTSPGYEFSYARDALAIVQFQSHAPQLNTYEALASRFEGERHANVWEILATRYPTALVEGAQAMYAARA